MAWLDKAKNLVDKVMQGPMEPSGGQVPVAMMATGERRGFKPGMPQSETGKTAQSQLFPPVQHAQPQQNAQPEPEKKRRSLRDWLFPQEEDNAAPAAAQTAQDPAFQNSGYYQSAQIPVVDQNAYQGTGYSRAAMPNTGFAQSAYQQPLQGAGYAHSAYQPPFQPQPVPQSGYQQPVTNAGFAQSAYQPTPSMQSSYMAQAPQPQPFAPGYQQPAPQPERRSRRGRSSQSEQPSDNVLYMNQNNFVDENGTAYSMVVRLAQPSSTAKCYRLIEFMRAGETVLVNLEQVRDAQEVSRCLDLLFGAAYAMNCTYTRVAERCIYLISPREVGVFSFTGLSQLNQRDNAGRWPGSNPDNPLDKAWEPQRERQAAGGWASPFAASSDSASSGGRNYRTSPVRYF